MTIVPLKLTKFFKKSHGRVGKLICRTKGRNLSKISLRFVDFYLNLIHHNIYVYIKYELDPTRNARLILCLTIDGFLFYILGANKQKFPNFFNYINFSNLRKIVWGQIVQIKQLREGDFIFNLSFYKNSYGQLCRSAGKYAQVMRLKFYKYYALVRLRNGKKLLIPNANRALFGVVNNEFNHNIIFGKAGSIYKFGLKPIVRGVARNPVDHPNGGRTPGGKVYRSFSFKIARSRKKTGKKHNLYINVA